ncbi:NmrA domain-containing protein [Mycena chlorophos]|uniref:NmrA domain-containing protein n=1 Tax=Mycena chlorophos TaxID=658473 RepID=A0A8H6SP72_MYCCL|nr:NmrA domain-containing protein [Mycena chlorophos]
MSTRIVSIIGATGLQGSSVVKALLKDGTFKPRAISRNPSSDASKALQALGAEVVAGDSLDKDSLVKALQGSEAVFAVTVPMFRLGDDTGKDETVQGKNMVDAAKQAGVKFFILSSLPSLKQVTNGKHPKAKGYEDKAVAEEYLKASGLAHASIHTAFFLENFWRFGFLKPSDTGFSVTLPIVVAETHPSMVWVERDVPAAVLGLLKGYNQPATASLVNGGVFPVVSTRQSFGEVTEALSKGMSALLKLLRSLLTRFKALGKPVEFKTSPPTGMLPVDEMWTVHKELDGLYGDIPHPNPDLVKLGVKLSTLDEFIENDIKPRFSS